MFRRSNGAKLGLALALLIAWHVSGLAASLGSQPDFEIVGQAATAVEAVSLAMTLRPDLILMEIRMPELDGASATQQIVANNPAARVLVLTTYSTDGDVLRAVEAARWGTC
ncbi:MAG: response regulator transcription factor [Gemmatimonadaceae bacterium]